MIEIRNLNYKNILKGINVEITCGINKEYKGEIINNKSLVYLNQNIYFSNRLPSRDFIQFIYGLDNIKHYKKNFFEYAEQYNLQSMFEKIWDIQVGMLSGGERSMLCFLGISTLDREWYIFDEPFAGVDEDNKILMIDIMQKLIDRGKGIIITSHEKEPLSKFENVNTIKIVDGRIIDNYSEFT